MIRVVAFLVAAVLTPPGVFHEGIHGDDGALQAPVSAGVAAPVVSITSPASSPIGVSTTPTVVSGTATNTPTSCTWATAPASGSGSCTGTSSFSCSVTQALAQAAAQTVTVTCSNAGGSGNDTTDVVFPGFQTIAGATTPNDLPDTMVFGGDSWTLVFACEGDDITAGVSAVCRDASGPVTLTETGAGTSPSSTIDTPFHALDSTERLGGYLSGQKRHVAATSAVGDIGTEDILVELVAGKTQGSGNFIIGKDDGTDGWSIFSNGSTAWRVALRTGGTQTIVTAATATNTTHYTHAFFHIDRDDAATTGANGRANGATGTGADLSARAGSLSNSTMLTLGGSSSTTSTTRFASVKVWKCAGCLPGGADNNTEVTPIARERAALAFGYVPGLAVGTRGPTTMTRASAARIDVIDGNGRALYQIGNGAPRVVVRGVGNALLTGILSEVGTTNQFTRTHEFDFAAWGVVTVGDTKVNIDSFTDPDLSDSAGGDGLDCLAGTDLAQCGVTQAPTLSATTHTQSIFFQAGQNTWGYVQNATVANAHAFFDLTACAACEHDDGDCPSAVGTVGGGVSQARAEPYHVDTDANGTVDEEWCRVSITFVGTAAAHTLNFGPADGDNDFLITEAADATSNIRLFGAQVEALPFASTYVSCTTVACSRSADDFRFDGASGNFASSPSTVQTVFACTNHASTVGGIASVGQTGTEGIYHQHSQTGQVARSAGIVGGATQWSISAAAGDLTNGAKHSIRTIAVTNDIDVIVDGASEGTDGTASVTPSASSSIYVGTTAGTAATQSNCALSQYTIWPRDVPLSEVAAP